VVGAKGYVGAALSSHLERNSKYEMVRVTRSDYRDKRNQSFDIVINCAMPSKRFWAKKNPYDDFVETMQKTADLFYGWRFKRFVHVSTVSARCELDSVYGRHKAAAEKICTREGSLIVRLGPMYSKDLAKGVLMDMLQDRQVFVSGETRYCFAPLDFIAAWIATHLDRVGVVEVGAKNTVRLQEIADHLGKRIVFEGPTQHQEIQNPEPDFPDAKGVFSYLDGMIKQGSKG